MPEAQIGSTNLPINVIPRIGGVPVTQTEILASFTNQTGTVVLAFTLEYQERDGTLNTQAWDETASTDSVIVFPVNDSFYANAVIWTLLPFWTVNGDNPEEKVYADESIQFAVKDLHRGL